MPVLDANSLEEFIARYQQDGVLWKADRLLSKTQNMILRNDNVKQIASTLALIPKSEMVLRDDYVKKICKNHNLVPKTLETFIAGALSNTEKQLKAKSKKQKGKKNVIPKLEGDPKHFKFFNELGKTDKEGNTFLDKIKFDKYKFTQLLKHFGYSRFETNAVGPSAGSEYTFVQLTGNVIKSVTREQIIDFVEDFIKHDYDFDGAKYELTDPLSLINAFYDQMRTMASKDLFARLRTDDPILINTDKKDATYLYYQNGFVEVNKTGWKLHNYEAMNGSVWEHQMLDRKFTPINIKDARVEDMGMFADFCFKLAKEDDERFKSLCSIIGYLLHDFYEYKLKAILFTDSAISEASEGRTGKTLISKMIGNVRSYCEINGKDFDATSLAKYQDANLGTQVLHLNDVKHKGRFRFDFEDVFNDITEGYIVKKLYMPTFRQYSKMVISTNKTLNIQGASQRDRIVEFEVSQFFGEHLSPGQQYGHWFPERNSKSCDWDEKEFNKFDNFMCFCSQIFHQFGLIEPEAINLGERKLTNHTHADFMEFMDDIISNLKSEGLPWTGYTITGGQSGFINPTCELHEFKFDKKQLYDRILQEYPDQKKWLKQRTFNGWLKQFGELRMGATPMETKSNSISYIQFVLREKK